MADTAYKELVSVALAFKNVYYSLLKEARDLRLNYRDDSVLVVNRESHANNLAVLEGLVERYAYLATFGEDDDNDYDSSEPVYRKVDVSKYGRGFGYHMGDMLETLRITHNCPLEGKKATKPLSLSLRRGIYPDRSDLELTIIGFHLFLEDLKAYNRNLADDIDSKVAPLFTANLLNYVYSDIMDPSKIYASVVEMHYENIITLSPFFNNRKKVAPTENGYVLKSNLPVGVKDFVVSLTNDFIRHRLLGSRQLTETSIAFIDCDAYKNYRLLMVPYIIKELKYQHYDRFNKPGRITDLVDAIRSYATSR